MAYIKLGDCFKQVAAGTLILLYDPSNLPFGIDPVNDGTPNSAGIYQLPLTHPCVIRCEKSNGSCTTSDLNITSWNQVFNIQKTADALQIRNANSQLEIALNWADLDFVDAFHERTIPIAPSYAPLNLHMGLSGSGSTPHLDCDVLAMAPDLLSGLGTPGDFNGPGNGDLINDIRSGNHPLPLTLSCEAVDASNDALGQIDLIITGGEADYEITWAPGTLLTTAAERSTIPKLAAGAYDLTLTDARGCTKTCSAEIELPDTETICKGACDSIGLRNDDSDYCYVWTANPEGPPLPPDAKIEVCPKETTEYHLTAIYNGRIALTKKYIVEVELFEPYIEPNNIYLCENGQAVLWAFPRDSSYEYTWSTGSDEMTTTIQRVGLYSVTVETDDGCIGMAEALVEE
ncbi:MAG: hypothetical protein AAFV25_22040 [Bacteroidota bacterium]